MAKERAAVSYGQLFASGSPSDPFGYNAQSGYYLDRQTGKYLLGHRYYDWSAGRFLTRDPIGPAGGMNLYGYCQDGPIVNADPTGETPPGLIVAQWLHEEKCKRIGYQIYKLLYGVVGKGGIKGLVQRYVDMAEDKLGLYPGNVDTGALGQGTWIGHRGAYANQQRALQKSLKKWQDEGCDNRDIPHGCEPAWDWAHEPAPNYPDPSRWRMLPDAKNELDGFGLPGALPDLVPGPYGLPDLIPEVGI